MSWRVPPIWQGGECWIIGGGPSMPREFEVPEQVIRDVRAGDLSPDAYSPYMKAIHDRHVIAINSAFMIGRWIDIVFFGDRRWFFNNRKALATWPGMKVTCHPTLNTEEYRREYVRFLGRDRNKPKGISDNPSKVCWNLNSGAAAISVAANAGCRRIVLLGFDMSLDKGGAQHWHNLYQKEQRKRNARRKEYKLPFPRHLAGFPRIADDAKRRKIEIINASPTSAIGDFPKMTVSEVLEICNVEKEIETV